MSGFVSLVGAGPGDPRLLTLAGRTCLERAEVVIADYLVNPALLLHCRPGTTIIQRTAGPRSGSPLDQAAVNRLLLEHASRGAYVVRLKGGDPCMFGRGGEEAELLVQHGIHFEFVPGVSSPMAAPECAGIPITHRDHTPAVSFVSGYEAYEKAGLGVAWAHLAQSAGTLVFMMSVQHARDNAERLIAAGRVPTTPAAVIRWGSRGIQNTLVGTLADIADRMDAAAFKSPAVLVVGDVVRLRERIAWIEQRPLFGRRIAITRGLDDGHEWIEALSQLGADVIPIPCISVTPQEHALRPFLQDLSAFDGIIVSSRHGVEALHRELERAELDVRALTGLHIAAIGEHTASDCRNHGLRPDLVASPPHSEGLVACLRERSWLARRWLHVRGDEGRDVVHEAVTDAGGSMEMVVAYRTSRPELPGMLLTSLAPPDAGGEGCDAIVFTSGKTARNFLSHLREHCDPTQYDACLRGAKIVSLGPVTTQALERLGLSVDATALEPTRAAVLTALAGVFATTTA